MSNEALIAEHNAEYNLDLSGIKLTDRETQIMRNFCQNEWSGVEINGECNIDLLLETETVTAWNCRYLYSRSNDICEGVKNPSGVVSSLNQKGLVSSYTDTCDDDPSYKLDCMALTELGTAMLVKMINDTPIADRKIFKRW